MEDPYVRDAEVLFVIKEIENFMKAAKRPLSILDAGCGNGYLLSVLCEKFPKHEFTGLEFTPELFEVASSRNHPNVKWVHGDVRKSHFPDNHFDIVITERVIINIRKSKEQYDALEALSKTLKHGGRYIMIESFKESLREINEARKEMGIEPLKESYQNKYIFEQQFALFEKNLNLYRIESEMPANYLSTHFYVTRVLHKGLRPKGGKVKFSRFANFFTEALPPAIGNYATIKFFLFEKRIS